MYSPPPPTSKVDKISPCIVIFVAVCSAVLGYMRKKCIICLYLSTTVTSVEDSVTGHGEIEVGENS